ncbi:hypothetical protein M3Y98_00315500 [Aphelenchoides besseyi]|nr:hypothetical protein M3Y98_00315500 [Aphelenchoides besseyi]
MISVTAAAHSFRRTSRSMGTHLKAYGSGRIALGSIDEKPENWDNFRTIRVNTVKEDAQSPIPLRRLFLKLWHALFRLFTVFCPFISGLLVHASPSLEQTSLVRKSKRSTKRSALDTLEDSIVLRILRCCDGQTIANLESTCRRLRSLVREHNDELPKIQKDQIKLYFDEGEIIIVPLDERIIPTRFPMPPLEYLVGCLRRLSISSLFIRGLIPSETIPVLRRLARYNLGASQIYFLWCEFDEQAGDYLKDLFTSNLSTLSDVGFEICSPPNVISDNLIEKNIPQIASLRIWHESFGVMYAITDRTLFRLADLFSTGDGCALETLDLSSVRITTSGVSALIEAWYRQASPSSHFFISLHKCCGVTRQDLVQQCQTLGIPLNAKGVLETRGFRLTLHIA